MPRALTIIGMVISALVIILFALDLAIGIPFKYASRFMDICFIIGAAGLGFLSWTTFRDLD